MPVLSQDLRTVKLRQLAKLEGYDNPAEMIARCIHDDVCPAICIDPICTFTAEYEPDQDQGYCELCGTNTVVSALTPGGLL